MALFDDTFSPYFPFGSRNLSLGRNGTDVAVLQALFSLMANAIQPAGALGSPIPVTGHFDAGTRDAVVRLQGYFGVSTDGVVGPVTFFLFDQGVGPNTTYGGPVFGSRQLQQGMSGGDVQILQNRLNTFRYSTILGAPSDGVFGAKTASAVLAFKADAAANGDTGFPANAIVGYGTYNAAWLYTFAGGRAIQTGRNGIDVLWLQTLLKQLGLYSGTLNGFYNTATRAAVMAFQTAQGITADGVVGPVTFYRLGLQNHVAPPAPFSIAWPTTPVAQVTVCSVALVTATSDLHPYGAAALVINESEGFESVDVVGNMLPAPSSYGAQYTQYAFTLTNPSTGTVIATELMTEIPGMAPNDWAGAYSPGVVSIPAGTVTVYAATATGVLGPTVLSGNLANCH